MADLIKNEGHSVSIDMDAIFKQKTKEMAPWTQNDDKSSDPVEVEAPQKITLNEQEDDEESDNSGSSGEVESDNSGEGGQPESPGMESPTTESSQSSIDDYDSNFLSDFKVLYPGSRTTISRELVREIRLLQVSHPNLSLSSFVNNVVADHFRKYPPAIEE